MKESRYIRFWMMMVVLLLGSVANHAWATNVTYHILTLPIDPTVYDYHMKDGITGWRLEAVKVTVNDQSSLELPAHYKSPLATNFKYYAKGTVSSSGSAQTLFDNNNNIKCMLYKVNGEDTPDDPSDDPTSVEEGTALSGTTADYYVVYTYNASNEIAKLDGSVLYNINTIGYDKGNEVKKGFIALNRGRNNRPAVLPYNSTNVTPEMLSSEDFVKVNLTGTKVTGYWKDGNNRNDEGLTGSKFFFMFKFEGVDPYNIIIRTAYEKDSTYIEKNDNNNKFVYKWYKNGSLFGVNNNKAYIASDEHILYNLEHNSTLYPTNPTNLIEGDGLGYTNRPGNYHGQTAFMYNSVALLSNNNGTGYLFMATRTNGSITSSSNPIYLKEENFCDNLFFKQISTADATNNLTIEGLYPIKKLTFKVATPFYDPESPSDAHIISISDWVADYVVSTTPIESKYLPAALKRKYIKFNGKFYSDPDYAPEHEITYFSQANFDGSEGYQVYVGYDVSPDAPKFLSPSDSYTTATWYEMTDEGSTQEYGRKIKNNSGTYKNNGANGVYEKESEFALVGNPYELKVLYRAGTTALSNSYVTLSGHASWEMPDDETEGSFLLREYKGTGHWRWDAGHSSADVTYGTNSTPPTLTKETQTFIINLTGLNGGKYYGISIGGAGASQIVSVTPEADDVIHERGTTATIVVQLAANTSVTDKTMTVTIQEYETSDGSSPSGSPSVIALTQGTATSSFAGNTVEYNTTTSTRVKLLELPQYDFTYHIVDKSGRIAVKASAKQTIFSPLSIASLPGIIVSPYIIGETLTFYDDAYVDGTGRGSLTNEISETPNAAADIYVTYTTARLDERPITLSEDQEFNVVLNGQYLWYDSEEDSILTKAAPTPDELKESKYLWKLRNRDPYAMLIDNLGAREVLPDVVNKVAGQTEDVTIYDDDGNTTSESRQKGAWVKIETIVNEGALTFTTDRAAAQRFIAKASTAAGVYEVMVATGTTEDASAAYYNIGRPAENTVKIYDKAHYTHGNDVLKFKLEQTIPYTYHLIDKSKHELFVLTSQSPDLALPDDYQSPLVATYHFYDPGNMNIAGGNYDTIVNPTELSKISDLDATYTSTPGEYASQWEEGGSLTATDSTDLAEKAKKIGGTGDYYYKIDDAYYHVAVTKPYYTHIYVTYDANELVRFNTGSYMLRFLEPFAEGYYLEDGNDKLTATKIQAVYPYCNGDGNLNIYGEVMQDEQFNGGASTRPRWVWYFDSPNSDPYHVRIRSKSTIKYNGVDHSTFLTTYAVHFNQDTGEDANKLRIVTGGTLPGVASAIPVEYMVLGSENHYKLMTTDSIYDGLTKERRRVTSFEQYWKTYNMAKLHVLEVSASTDAYSDDASTWVVPASHRTILEGKDWHSYSAYANAVRWNGYNDKSDGHEKKVVEKLEHWYQTFDMGNGTFDIESADIPPVLILLDLHGWEIMRLPLPTTNYPEGDAELAALRVYDSPMVKEYKFYSNATKATGCHKYTLRMQDDVERDQIKVSGKHYTSTSLGNLPPISATGVKSGGVFNDQYVTYTVKEEYEKSYSYHFTDNGNGTYSESGTPSKFLILLSSRFFRYNDEGGTNVSYFSKPIFEASYPSGGNVYDAILSPSQQKLSNLYTNVDTNKDGIIDDNNLWFVQPNLNIDEEMGIKWGASDDITASEPLSEYGTKKKYKDITGFDPYNIQLQNVSNNKYVTAHQDTAHLTNGIMAGVYKGPGDTTNLTLETQYSYAGYNPLTPTGSEGYDHTNLNISNQTFMAVSDANGNMQLMPRFDHTKRVNINNNSDKSYTTLQPPVNHDKASADANASMGPQTIFFVRPQVQQYHIMDNFGREAIRYKRAGDDYPAVTEHFKSPLAKDYSFYTGLAKSNALEASSSTEWEAAGKEFRKTLTSSDLLTDTLLLPTSTTYYYKIGKSEPFVYKKVTVTKGLLEQKIESSLPAEAELASDVYVRYDYDADADHDADKILEGRWFTITLAGKELKSSETRVSTTAGSTQGTNVNLYQGESKPSTINQTTPLWQWKFLAAPMAPSSEYYVAPDPYAVQLFNRYANYTDNPTVEPSPMAVGIKVPNNETTGVDRFVLLSHPDGDYALAAAGTESYNYRFLNGADMTTSVAADTVEEASFTQKIGVLSAGAKLSVNNDVTYNFEYRVVNKTGKYAVSATQTDEETEAHEHRPYLPEAAQTPLLREDDYTYYGFAVQDEDTYTMSEPTKLFTLYGLYDDIVWVTYADYDVDKTNFKIPNKKALVDGKVARDPASVDVSMNINGELPYNIIWYSDTIMKTEENSTTITYDINHPLDGDKKYVWYFKGNDPYSLKIEHKQTGFFINGTTTLVENEEDALDFMLLRKNGYDYGVLQVTGTTGANAGKKLTGYGQTLTPSENTAPTKFIIFGLSVHDLIYHLIIAKTCPDKTNLQQDEYVDIPYKETESVSLPPKRIYGTTQRDLISVKEGYPSNLPGTKYQLGDTVNWGGANHTYSLHMGSVSIGDDLKVPNEFYRPNCTFEFYIEGIYDRTGQTAEADLNTRFQGLKSDKLVSSSELIDKTVVVNIVYEFDTTLATNTGLGFVTDTAQNLWYTYETQVGPTPYLAHYTNAWGLQSMAGRETRYTNDYLWTPLGDVYGFKMYNRYMLKNSGNAKNVMTMKEMSADQKLVMAEPSSPEKATDYPAGYEVFELIASIDVPGYFRVHPVLNTTEPTLYVSRKNTSGDIDDDGLDDKDYTILSTTPCDWMFGLDMTLLEPYYVRAGYVGGLNAAGKTAYEEALTKKIIDIQNVVYNDDNIIPFTEGYYRLHNQPGVSGISPVRYASGYLHDIEKTGDGVIATDTLPMHFYSKAGVSATFAGNDINALGSGYTVSKATQGDIPIPATEYDPSTIFYLKGAVTNNKTISTATMSTQGLNVLGNKMTEEAGTKFTLIDIGGAVFLVVDKLDPYTRKYLNFGQTSNIYDLKFMHDSPTDDAKWCLQPVQKTSTAGNGEMPLMVATNNGGDGYYYTTFYAPFDVLLTDDSDSAYVCKKWHDEGVNPSLVPASGSYEAGKFIPAATPVIIRTGEESESVTLALPSTTPSPAITSDLKGSYLEGLLAVDAAHDVYTLGLPMISDVRKDEDYVTSGNIVAPLPEFDNTGVGFYINATRNKEADPLEALWRRNNRYVLHNKVYYRAPSGPASAPGRTNNVSYVPMFFGNDDDQQPDGNNPIIIGDGCAYDILGRKVATKTEVQNGTWWRGLQPGIYIVDGKKIFYNAGQDL